MSKKIIAIIAIILALTVLLISCGSQKTAEDTSPVESNSPAASTTEPTEEPEPAPETVSPEPTKEPEPSLVVPEVSPEPSPVVEPENSTELEPVVEPTPEPTPEQEPEVTPAPEQTKQPVVEEKPTTNTKTEVNTQKAPVPEKEQEDKAYADKMQQESQQAQQSTAGKFTYPPGASTAGLPAGAIEQGIYYLTDGSGRMYDQDGNRRGTWGPAMSQDVIVDTEEEIEAGQKADQEWNDKHYNGSGEDSDTSAFNGN